MTPSNDNEVQTGLDGFAIDDQALIRALRNGEPRAAEYLYEKLYPSVSRALSPVSKRVSDYEDLVQTVFERVIRSLLTGQFRGSCSLESWTWTIARSAAHDTLRAQYRKRLLFADQEPSDPQTGVTDPERALTARSELRVVQRVFKRLPNHLGTAVIMADALGCEVAEIASATGISESAAHSRVRRGRLELRRRVSSKLGLEAS